MGLIKPKTGANLPSLSNPAGANNIQVGYEAIDYAGNKIVGTHTEEQGLDTSDATAAATDIANYKTAYVNGEKVTGSLYEPSAMSLGADDRSMNENGDIVLARTVSSDFIMRAGKVIAVKDSAYNFGDATSDDVTEGKTFTSSAGLKVTGTSTKIDTSDADATSADILTGKTAYVNGEKVTGNHVCKPEKVSLTLNNKRGVGNLFVSYVDCDGNVTTKYTLYTGSSMSVSVLKGSTILTHVSQSYYDNHVDGNLIRWCKYTLGDYDIAAYRVENGGEFDFK